MCLHTVGFSTHGYRDFVQWPVSCSYESCKWSDAVRAHKEFSLGLLCTVISPKKSEHCGPSLYGGVLGLSSAPLQFGWSLCGFSRLLVMPLLGREHGNISMHVVAARCTELAGEVSFSFKISKNLSSVTNIHTQLGTTPAGLPKARV